VIQRADNEKHQTVTVNDVVQPDGAIKLVDDRREHVVVVSVGRSSERTFSPTA
jgi:hypothetical protein